MNRQIVEQFLKVGNIIFVASTGWTYDLACLPQLPIEVRLTNDICTENNGTTKNTGTTEQVFFRDTGRKIYYFRLLKETSYGRKYKYLSPR
jgi:hypothetical protein